MGTGVSPLQSAEVPKDVNKVMARFDRGSRDRQAVTRAHVLKWSPTMITNVQKKLFTPMQIGSITLKHRIVMAPLTRLRAQRPSGIPSDLQLDYPAYGGRRSTLVQPTSYRPPCPCAVPIIPLPGISLPGFASGHGGEWFHRMEKTLCYHRH